VANAAAAVPDTPGPSGQLIRNPVADHGWTTVGVGLEFFVLSLPKCTPPPLATAAAVSSIVGAPFPGSSPPLPFAPCAFSNPRPATHMGPSPPLSAPDVRRPITPLPRLPRTPPPGISIPQGTSVQVALRAGPFLPREEGEWGWKGPGAPPTPSPRAPVRMRRRGVRCRVGGSGPVRRFGPRAPVGVSTAPGAVPSTGRKKIDEKDGTENTCVNKGAKRPGGLGLGLRDPHFFSRPQSRGGTSSIFCC